MPSLSDIASDAQAILNDIKSNTAGTNSRLDTVNTNLTTINSSLTTINLTLNTGFTTLAAGLFAIFEAQKKTNNLLETNAEQNRTIICWLGIMAELLCSQLRVMEQDLEVQKEIRSAVEKLLAVLELVHAREAMEVDRLAELKRKLEECCPPRVPEPEPCFRPCPEREVAPYDPKGQDWTPPRQQVPTQVRGKTAAKPS